MQVTLVIDDGERRELQANLPDPPQIGDLIELRDGTRIEVTAIEPAHGETTAIVHAKPGGLPWETPSHRIRR